MHLTGKLLCALGCLLLAPLTYAQVALPEIGDASGAYLSAADERKLGEAFMREIRSRITIIDDPEIAGYVQSLGYRLVSNGPEPGSRFTFFVLDDPAINAFAAPGGFIGLNSGLILAAESESELAAVMAHEIAHVTQRHIARTLQAAGSSNLTALAGMVAALVLGAYDSQAGAAAATAVTAGRAQYQINFTRANEEEADRIGIQILANSDLDPRAVPIFFERLQQSYRYYSEPPEFLSTHPVTVSRIADSRSRAEQYPYRHFIDSKTYHLVRAKLQVLVEEDPVKAVKYFETKLKDVPQTNAEAAKYGYALALARVNENQRARNLLKELAAADPDRVSYRVALGRLELATGRAREALDLYAEVYRLYPDDRLLIRGYADALLRTREPDKALKLLDDYRSLNELDATMYKLEAQAHELMGSKVDAQVALAEHYYLNGRLREAIHQLNLARTARDENFHRASRVEARLRQLKEEQAERAKR